LSSQNNHKKGSNNGKALSIILILLITLSSNTHATNAWYYGKISSVVTLGANGSFQVKFDNPEVQANCKYKVVYFNVSDMGLERTKLAFSMALTAFTTDKEWGVVINLPEASEDLTCSAASNSSQGAGIR